MNNSTTQYLTVAAILMAAVIVVGTFATIATTQPAFAYSPKKPRQDPKKRRDNGGSGNSRNGDTITALKCQNKGSATGFDTALTQECASLICTHPGNNATCTQEGAVAPQQTQTPTPTTTTLRIIKKFV